MPRPEGCSQPGRDRIIQSDATAKPECRGRPSPFGHALLGGSHLPQQIALSSASRALLGKPYLLWQFEPPWQIAPSRSFAPLLGGFIALPGKTLSLLRLKAASLASNAGTRGVRRSLAANGNLWRFHKAHNAKQPPEWHPATVLQTRHAKCPSIWQLRPVLQTKCEKRRKKWQLMTGLQNIRAAASRKPVQDAIERRAGRFAHCKSVTGCHSRSLFAPCACKPVARCQLRKHFGAMARQNGTAHHDEEPRTLLPDHLASTTERQAATRPIQSQSRNAGWRTASRVQPNIRRQSSGAIGESKPNRGILPQRRTKPPKRSRRIP